MGAQEHVMQDPLYRRPIYDSVAAFARALDAEERVLDAGAGQAPFRELFGHCAYMTADWPETVHRDALNSDIVADLSELPLADATFDAIVCTEVLEHLLDAPAVLRELRRVLRPGGRALFTAPFVIGLHEAPYDFARYTSFGLRHLAEQAGWEVVDVWPLSGSFSVVVAAGRHAVLHRGAERRGPVLWRKARGRAVAEAIRLAVRAAPRLDRADRIRSLPLGWAMTARAPQ